MSAREPKISTTKPAKQTKQKKKPGPNDSQCASENSEQDSVIDVDSQLYSKLDAVSVDVKKIRGEMDSIMKKDDIQELVKKTISEITKQLEKKIMSDVKKQIDEKFERLNEEIKSLKYENEQLKEAMEKKVNKICESADKTDKKIEENKNRVQDAIKLGNYNEQYSRKNNIKIMNIPDGNQETEDDLIQKVGDILSNQGVELRASQVLAIHRLPFKNGQIRPVIVKVTNNNVKTGIMRQRKSMKAAGHRLVDDVTRLNTGLINRLNNHELIDSAWFFNGSVFGKTLQGKRLKFDIFDDVAEVIANNQGDHSTHKADVPIITTPHKMKTITEMFVYIGGVNLLIISCLLGWPPASATVPTMYSVDEDCLQEYVNGKTMTDMDNYENYTLYARQITNLEMYTYQSSYNETEENLIFQIELLGKESDEERRLNISWELDYTNSSLIISTLDHPQNKSLEQIFLFEFSIAQQTLDEPGRESRTKRDIWTYKTNHFRTSDDPGRKRRKRSQLRSYRTNFDCLKISRGLRTLTKFCYLPLEEATVLQQPECTRKEINTIRCSCEGVTVHLNDSTSGANETLEVFYTIPYDLKMSVDIINNDGTLSANSINKLELYQNNGSVKIPDVPSDNFTVQIKMNCEDFSTLRADQECYFMSYNITKNITQNSPESEDSSDSSQGLLMLFMMFGFFVVIVVVIYICSTVYFKRQRKIQRQYESQYENSIPKFEDVAYRLDKIENVLGFYKAPVSGNPKEHTFMTSKLSSYTTKDTTKGTTKSTTTSKVDCLDNRTNRTGKRSTKRPFSLRDEVSDISTVSNSRVNKPDQVQPICKESTCYQPLEKICVVTPVFAGESPESDTSTNTQAINGQNGHENEQDVDWGRVFTFLIPKLCTLEWRFFAIELLSKVHPHEENIEAIISRLEQQSKSLCGGDEWQHKLRTILDHWKTHSEAPTMEDIRNALRDSGYLWILNDMKNWTIPLKPKPNEVHGTIKKAISLPELEYRIEQHSTNLQVLPCFDMKRPLDQLGASHISSETDFNYQYAQRDVYIGQKRKFACFSEGNCIGNPVIDLIVQLTEHEKICIKLVYEVLHLDAERILDNEEFRVYVKYVISIIQKESSRELYLVDIIKLKFELYEGCEHIQSTRNGTMHIISNRRCRIILMDNDWKFLKLYVERARSQIIERFPDSDKAYLFLTHDGKQVSSGYLGVDETNSTIDPRKHSETYKRRRTSESMAVVPRKKMNTALSRMRESSSEESDHENTEAESESTNTEEFHRGSLVRRSKKWCRRRRSSSSRLSKKRGKTRQTRGQRDSETPNYFGAIDYEKLAEAIVKKQSEMSKSSSTEGSVDNKSNLTVSPEPMPSTSTD